VSSPRLRRSHGWPPKGEDSCAHTCHWRPRTSRRGVESRRCKSIGWCACGSSSASRSVKLAQGMKTNSFSVTGRMEAPENRHREILRLATESSNKRSATASRRPRFTSSKTSDADPLLSFLPGKSPRACRRRVRRRLCARVTISGSAAGRRLVRRQGFVTAAGRLTLCVQVFRKRAAEIQGRA